MTRLATNAQSLNNNPASAELTVTEMPEPAELANDAPISSAGDRGSSDKRLTQVSQSLRHGNSRQASGDQRPGDWSRPIRKP